MENKYNLSISKEKTIEFDYKILACVYDNALILTETMQELFEFKITDTFDDALIDKIKNNPNEEYFIKINDMDFDSVKLKINGDNVLIYRSWH